MFSPYGTKVKQEGVSGLPICSAHGTTALNYLVVKDHFSQRPDQYAKYRPAYPPAVFAYLGSLVASKECAWDCGTGNGQAAYELAKTFAQVFATDISQAQLDQAPPAPNLTYSCQPAEATNFGPQQFDLVVVAQAIHWFDFAKFYAEVRRTARPGALLCVLGYGRLEIDDAINRLIDDFYHQTIGRYWDKERRYIDELYQTIPFPFAEIEPPRFANQYSWSLDHLVGYLNTWSAVKQFAAQQHFNPVDMLRTQLADWWGDAPERLVNFPLLLRVGRVE
jgi:SAM-dependent methyltransferase